MGMLDAIIDKNTQPKEGMEYIYTMDMVWKIGSFETVKINKRTIVTDVKRMPNNSLQFTVKETGERYESNYGWAFVENTDEANKIYAVYLEKEKILQKLKKECFDLLDSLPTLKEVPDAV